MQIARVLWGAVLAVGLGAPLAAQQMTVAKVVFDPPGPFAQADLEAVAGVHPGQKVVLAQIQAAAQRLADTGCFDDVHVDSNGQPAALVLKFLLKPNVQGTLYEVAFDNFVMLRPAELQEAVHASAPLFGNSGKLPETGAILDAVDAGLTAALAAKGLAGAEVSHTVKLADSHVPVPTVLFRVNRPAVVLRTIQLRAEGPEAAEVKAMAAKLPRARYHAGTAPGSTAAVLLEPLREAGYLDAHLADERVEAAPATDGVIPVDLTAEVKAGAAYRVGAVTFTPTPAVSAEAFAAGAKLHAGDVASPERLWKSELPVEVAYHKLGYPDVYVAAQTTRDEGAHLVSYALHVVPGEVYRVRSTQVVGLPPAAKAQFDLAWKLAPGELYNPDYVGNFLANNTAMRELADFVGSFQAAADPSTHMVDLTIQFQPVPATKRR